ncbi:ficolin-1-like [Mercenaria mercenaria]|uniref:ficolin-1-like n=1 Tax=Mercenaria mercenaria TaxID=6596 RepID=UPI00234EAAD6|nr:ficolin-1-like [Mercenaria mercenaria]
MGIIFTLYKSKGDLNDPDNCRGADCKDILEKDSTATSGIYEIKPWKTREKIKVFCDMETSGGGWTVIHNRFDGSVDFYRNFKDYENGFGDIAGEFWLGLKYIQEISQKSSTQLRLTTTANNGDIAEDEFEEFRLENGTEYRLSYAAIWGSVCLPNLSGIAFTTKDKDMDYSTGNCAVELNSAWWYLKCTSVDCNLNDNEKKYGMVAIENGTRYY